MSGKAPLSDDQIITILLTLQQQISETKGRVNGVEKRLESHEKRITAGERFNKAIVVVAGVVALIVGFISSWLAKLFGLR